MKKNGFICCVTIILMGYALCNSYAIESDNQKFNETYGSAGPTFAIATGSPGSLGLLRALAEPFCRDNNCRINWIEKGSGASLKTLKEGRVDMVMVHAPEAEKEAVKEGWAAVRTLMGGNEFFIVGPDSDPAGIMGAGSAREAYSMISRGKAKFFSRGDNSGTHKKEVSIWEDARIKPEGSWYIVTNDFMEPTLFRADAEKGYFMTDSSTFFANKLNVKYLKVLLRGDPVLINVYHALAGIEDNNSTEVYSLVTKFIDYIKSEEGQKILREYGENEYGYALYMDAKTARKYEK